jgi:hypothetical protein
MNSLEEINKGLVNLPPLPPPPPEIPSKVGNGNFEYISDRNEKEMLTNAFKAITETNLWDFMAKDIYSYMFSSEKEVTKIGNKMIDLGYGLHSGASFGWTMRAMQYLAQHGENEFKLKYYDINSL